MEERNGQIQEQERNVEHMHSLCKQHMYCHVTLTMQDGTKTHGIIYQVDHQNVYMFIPQDYAGHSGQYPSREEGSNDERIWGRPWGWGGWGWGRPWFYRRFFPGFFPLASIAALSLFPYYGYPFYPYPYYW